MQEMARVAGGRWGNPQPDFVADLKSHLDNAEQYINSSKGVTCQSFHNSSTSV